MINRLVLFAVVVLFMTTAITHAPGVWRGPPHMLTALDNETQVWVEELRNKFGGQCCDAADGYPAEISGWDMAGIVDDTSAMNQWDASLARSGYRVRLADGK